MKQDLDSGALALPNTTTRSSKFAIPWRSIAILLALALAVAFAWLRLRPADRRSASNEHLFTQLTTQTGREQFPTISPDGKWIVYDGNQAGNSDIYLQSVGGQNPINLTKDSPDDDTQPAFSPDGERIAFRSERQGGGIFVMGRTGESVRRITDTGYTPAWSPDGTQLVFATSLPSVFQIGPSDLWAVTLASGERRSLSVKGIQPSWSPHGHRIAYWTAYKEGAFGQRDIDTIPAEGGTPVPVTSDAALDWNPVWSPDGRHLYFASNRGGSMNLWRVAIDEQSGQVLSQPEPLTTPSALAGHLSVSADGRRVAYASFERTAPIQTVPFDPVSGTITAAPVTVVGGTRFLSWVAPSPDGQWLAYYSIGNQMDLLISRSDGSGERELTHDTAIDRYPSWSPDGRQIALLSNRSGQNQIWSIRPDGSDLRQLTFAPDGCVRCQVVTERLTHRVCRRGVGEMFVFEPAKPWTAQTPQQFSRVVEPGVLFAPSGGWSPDGTRLLGEGEPAHGEFMYSFGGVFTYSFASRQFTRLTRVGQPWTWLNDSRRALFTHRGSFSSSTPSRRQHGNSCRSRRTISTVSPCPATTGRCISHAKYNGETSG